jgi:hypothetical protein
VNEPVDVTNGELYRTLQAMRTDHGQQLAGILSEAKLTNGRLRRAELGIAVLQVGYLVGAFIFGGVFLWALNSWAWAK